MGLSQFHLPLFVLVTWFPLIIPGTPFAVTSASVHDSWISVFEEMHLSFSPRKNGGTEADLVFIEPALLFLVVSGKGRKSSVQWFPPSCFHLMRLGCLFLPSSDNSARSAHPLHRVCLLSIPYPLENKPFMQTSC